MPLNFRFMIAVFIMHNVNFFVFNDIQFKFSKGLGKIDQKVHVEKIQLLSTHYFRRYPKRDSVDYMYVIRILTKSQLLFIGSFVPQLQ